jgi:hypothetical protein
LFGENTANAYIYDKKRAYILAAVFMVLCAVMVIINTNSKERLKSIETSTYNEKGMGSINMRFELWKDSLLIFHDHPVFGVGTWDFHAAIENILIKGN